MSEITGFEYHRLVKLVRCIEVDLRNFLETESEISWEEAWGESIAKHDDEEHARELENFDPISIAEQREATK